MDIIIAPSTPQSKSSIRILWVAAGLVALMTALRLPGVLRNYSQIDSAAGVWTALGDDAAHGIFYRPLHDPSGYGGTRYFPLHFVLHGMLIAAGAPPIAGGLALAVACGAALVAGTYVLLRRLGVAWELAAPCAVCVLASLAGQWGISTIRGDMMAAALNVWGLAFCAGVGKGGKSVGLTLRVRSFTRSVKTTLQQAAWADTARRNRRAADERGEAGANGGETGRSDDGVSEAAQTVRRQASEAVAQDDGGSRPPTDPTTTAETTTAAWPVLAAIFFVLAFAAKVTTVFGLVAAVVALLAAERRREALRLGLVWGIGAAGVLLATQLASGGRFLASLHACAASGADVQTLLTAPTTLIALAMRFDAGGVLFWMLAAATLLYIPRACWRELPSLALVLTALVTVFVYGSPGISLNHNIDLHVMAIVFFAVQIARLRIVPSFGRLSLACAVILSTVGTIQRMRIMDDVPRHRQFVRTLQVVGGTLRPVLYEEPALAVLAHQRPWMLDPYMFAVMGQHDPAVADDLATRLARHDFAAIVLLKDPAGEESREYFDSVYFGRGFRQSVLSHYERLPQDGTDRFIFVPRSGETDDTAALPHD